MINEYFKELEQNHRIFLSLKLPVVIRLDGKDITKNHKKYPLMDIHGFTCYLNKIGKKIVSRKTCMIYTALDEINFIFSDSREFFHAFDDTNSLYCAGIFLQQFCKEFWKYYPEVKFGISIFSIPKDKIDEYVNYRKELCKTAAVFYFAKENLTVQEYKGKTEQELIRYLKFKKLYSKLATHPFFMTGIQTNIRTDFWDL